MQHNKTIENIKAIEHILKSIKSEQDKTNARIKEWAEDKTYHPDHIAAKISTLKLDMEQYAATFSDRLYNHIAAIADAENELTRSVIDLNDTAFVNAVQLVQTIGKEMPYEQQQRIAEQFKGNYPAEAMLSDLYDKIGMTYVVKLTNFNDLCYKLRRYTEAFTSQREKTAAGFRGIEKTLNDMLEGVQSDYRVALGVSDMAFMESVCAAAGVPVVR